ncbi:MAG TPA: hypothetical protein VG033_08075 [Candidatus Acidoferrales bacterium]|jgi:hypothetical protein|nr:hypothetical protein [Candidatus Acidoferrales bacterium]
MIFGKFAMGLLGTAVVGAAMVSSEGFVNVRVHEKQPGGHNIHVIAPALLIPLSMRFAPQHSLDEATAQMKEWLPTIRAAMEGLRECADADFVEVTGPGEHVQVSKSGGAIVVDVDDEGETVHVSVPVRAMENAVEDLAERAPVESAQAADSQAEIQ